MPWHVQRHIARFILDIQVHHGDARKEQYRNRRTSASWSFCDHRRCKLLAIVLNRLQFQKSSMSSSDRTSRAFEVVYFCESAFFFPTHHPFSFLITAFVLRGFRLQEPRLEATSLQPRFCYCPILLRSIEGFPRLRNCTSNRYIFSAASLVLADDFVPTS